MSSACASVRARSDGGYREPRERAVLFVDGRLDRVIENAGEPCAGAAYAPFAGAGKDDAVAARLVGRREGGVPGPAWRSRDGTVNAIGSLFGEA